MRFQRDRQHEDAAGVCIEALVAPRTYSLTTAAEVAAVVGTVEAAINDFSPVWLLWRIVDCEDLER